MPGLVGLDKAERLLRWGRFQAAATAFEEAAAGLSDDRDRSLALLGAARALSALGEAQSAVSSCRSAIRLQPRNLAAQGLLAMLLLDVGALDAAGDAARSALTHDPSSPAVLNLCALVALRRGRRKTAVRFATLALGAAPSDQRARSLLALASDAAENHLLDLERLALLELITPPTTFGDLDEFNRALADAILRRPDLGKTAPGAPLSNGRRLPDLRGIPHQLLAPLELAFRAAAAKLAPRLAHSPGFTGQLAVRGWANVMQAGSSESPHIHEGGWISGVYYVAMPASGGEIVLGGHDLGEDIASGPTRTLRPKAGDLLVFPSYLYHSVPAVRCEGLRISIAVDLAPEAAAV